MASITEILQLCRLCLVKEQVNVPIFEEQGDIRQIFLKITACLPVKISREDKLPKKICSGCLYKLELLYQFWNTSTNAEKQLLSWLSAAGMDANTQTTQDAMAVVTQTQVVLKQEPETTENVTVVSDPDNFILQAATQPIEFPAVDFDYQENFSTAEQELANNSINAAADDSSESEPLAKRARRAATSTVTAPLIESEDDDADDPGEAVAAKTEEDSDDDTNMEPTFVDVAEDQDDEQPGPSGLGKIVEPPYHRHTKMTSPGPKKANHLSFLSKNNALSKLKETRKLKVKYKRKYPLKKKTPGNEDVKIYEPIHCDICDKTFENNVAYGLHSVEHNDKYSCHICDYSTALKYSFEMHIKVHEGRTAYKCEICNKAFTVSTHAIEHKNFHTGEKPFKCDFCDKAFMFSWFLSSHRRSQHFEMVTGEKLVKYDCTVCNKHYTSATGLKRHRLSKHNTDGIDTTALCDICGKCLSTKEKLKFHRRIHTGYKPYMCVVCGKSFVRKEQLKEHERVHTGEKPHICKFCGKGFTQRSPLKIHERIHTGERPYICRLCNKGYISKGVMDTHMKNCGGMA